MAGAVDVRAVVRLADDDDGDILEVKVLANPAEDLKSAATGHIEVEADQQGDFTAAALGFHGALQVFDGFETVANDVDGVGETCLGESAFHEENVVFVVLGQQNNRLVCHNAGSEDYGRRAWGSLVLRK